MHQGPLILEKHLTRYLYATARCSISLHTSYQIIPMSTQNRNRAFAEDERHLAILSGADLCY